jgi:hypothetical protein
MEVFSITVPGVWGEDARIDLELLKKTARKELESEGEVRPVVLLENPFGLTAIPAACGSTREKHIFFRLFLPALIRATGTTRLGLVHEVWFYREKEGAPGSAPPPSQHPRREEAVSIVVLSADSVKGLLMTIVREDGKASVGEVYESSEMVLDLLRECVEALRDVAKEISR